MEEVIKLLKKDGRTMYEIAKEVGVAPSSMSRILRGEQKSLNLNTAFKLADTLGVDINEFRKER